MGPVGKTRKYEAPRFASPSSILSILISPLDKENLSKKEEKKPGCRLLFLKHRSIVLMVLHICYENAFYRTHGFYDFHLGL